jgi:hypothetical protein
MDAEISSRSYFEGKRRGAKNSRFKLPADTQAQTVTDGPAEGPKEVAREHRAFNNALMSSLLPGTAAQSSTPWKQQSSLKGTMAKSKERAKPSTEKDVDHALDDGNRGQILTSSTSLLLSSKVDPDPMLTEWQKFSLGRSKDMKNAPHVTLPILGSYTRVHRQGARDTVQVEKGTSGSEITAIKGPSSYVDVFKKNLGHPSSLH